MRESSIDEKWLDTVWGKLCVKSFGYDSKRKKHTWICQCECGNTVEVLPYLVKSGHTKSCGCYKSEKMKEVMTTHGKTDSRLYSIYNGMKNRCYNVNQFNYPNYGGRGITICNEWLNSFAAFHEWAVTHGYSDELSIDRIDNDKGYSPDNCRWATRKEQQRNTTTNHLFSHNGKTQTISAWAEEQGLNFHTVENRIHVMKMNYIDALELEVSSGER